MKITKEILLNNGLHRMTTSDRESYATDDFSLCVHKEEKLEGWLVAIANSYDKPAPENVEKAFKSKTFIGYCEDVWEINAALNACDLEKYQLTI